MMTIEEINDTITNHLIKQTVQALNEKGQCSYLTTAGLKCAVGCLIKEEYYDPSFEGVSMVVPRDDLKEALYKSGVNTTDPKIKLLLTIWQGYHDDQPVFQADKVKAKAQEILKAVNV